MKNIIYIPLDERPCNYDFPVLMAKDTEYNILVPPREFLGDKKIPADVQKLWKWLLENVKNAQGAILSIDMLIYGGIVPSRLHSYTFQDCTEILEKIKQLKDINPILKVFAFNLIMRCPQYSSSDEEPDYYNEYGREIFRYGYISHRASLNIADENELKELSEIKEKLPQEILDDYIKRRSVNREVNKEVINYVKHNFIDFLVIPQDDSAPYGLTAIDQQYVRKYVIDNRLNTKIYMYPGADELGCTLLARMINQDKNLRPMVYPRFSSTYGPFVIPSYEDRMLLESVKYQVLCAGGLLCSSLSEADIILMVNSPGKFMQEGVVQDNKDNSYNVERNITEFLEYAKYVVNIVHKPCIIADVAFANGADIELIKLLHSEKLLFNLAGYAGWNTSANSLGTCICQGMLYNIYGCTQKHLDFLGLRYLEDAGYCAKVRRKVTNERLGSMGLNYFEVDGQRGKVSQIVRNELAKFAEENLNYYGYSIQIEDCYMPWRRMFEVGLKVKVKRA